MSGETIRPALWPSEWATALRADPLYLPGGSPFAQLNVGVDACFDGTFDAEALPAVIALANAARDDADPGKLTWADVKVLGEASVIFRVGDVETATDERATARLRALAAKLAAILPPEGT